MTGRLSRLAGPAIVAAFAGPAIAAPLEFSGEVQGRAGYASNPFLRTSGINGTRNSGGSPSVGGRVTGVVTRREAVSTTSFTAAYQRDEYLKGYSASDSLNLDAMRQQTFSAKLNGNARLYYNNSRNAFGDPIDDIDVFTAGNRRRTIGAEAGLNATFSARDAGGVSVFANRTSYAARGLSNFNQYGATGYYSRTFTENTSAGLSLTVSRTDTRLFGDTTTYQPNLTFKHRFSAVWQFDGSIGVIFQDRRLGGISEKSTSIGFSGDLCATYPLSSLCFQASRNTSATGFGGLTTQTTGGVRYSRQLSERSRLNASVNGGESNSERLLLNRDQTFAAARVGYEYDLNQRISIGGSADYRYRKFRGFGSAEGYSGIITLTAKFGRTQ